MGQKLAAYNVTGNIIGFYDSDDSPAPASVTVLKITDDQWQECLSTPGWTVANGKLVAPEAPSDAQLLAMAQATQTTLMYQAYQTAISQAVTYKTAGGVTKAFQADSDSQSTLVSALTGYQAAGAVPAGFWWVSEDNTQVPFTLSDLKGLAAAMLAQGWAAFQTLQARKASIRATTARDEAQAITW